MRALEVKLSRWLWVWGVLYLFATPADAGDVRGQSVIPKQGDIALFESAETHAVVVGTVHTGTILIVRERKNAKVRVPRGWLLETDVIDCASAMKSFTSALQRSPTVSVYVSRSFLFWHFGKYRDAEADATHAIDMDSKNPQGYVARGAARLGLGNSQAALADFNEAIALDPRGAAGHFWRGCALLELGKIQEATADFGKTIESGPRHHAAYAARAYIHLLLGQNRLAVSDLSMAVRLDPSDAESWANRGAALAKLGEFQAAIDDLDRAIQLAPDCAVAFNTRGFARMSQKRYADACLDFDRAIQLAPQDWEAYNNRGVVCRKSDKLESAISDFTRAIELAPRQAHLYRNRAGTYYSLRDYARALRDYKVAVEIAPDDPRPHAWTAWILATCSLVEYRDGARAIASATKSCELSKWQNAWFLTVMAAAHAEARDFKGAVHWQEEALKLEQLKEEIHFMRQLLRLYRAERPYRVRDDQNIVSKLFRKHA